MNRNDPDIRDYLGDETSETVGRCAGVDYRLQGPRTRFARRRAVRALRKLDPVLARLAKQMVIVETWKTALDNEIDGFGAIANQPTTWGSYATVKGLATAGEIAATTMVLNLAGINGSNMQLVLALGMATLLVQLGQRMGRTLKKVHLAATLEDDAKAKAMAPSSVEKTLAGASAAFIIVFALALTELRSMFGHAVAHAATTVASSPGGSLAVSAPHTEAPPWVLGVIALVAPLLAMFVEFGWHDPVAHKARRLLRLYNIHVRKARFILRRSGRAVSGGRRALLLFDGLRSRGTQMKKVIVAAHGGQASPTDDAVFDADEPIRQLRGRLEWYDAAAATLRNLLVEPLPVERTTLEGVLKGALANGNGNGKPPKKPKAVA